MLFMLNSWSCFSADTPRAEYPRPQFEREQWVNLNGTWTFDFDFALASGNTDFLFAARTGINVIFFALLHDIFFSEKSLSDTGGH